MKRSAPTLVVIIALAACPGSENEGTTTMSVPGSSSSGSGQPATESGASTELGDSTGSESGEGTAATDTGPMCTGESCSSRLTMTFGHNLALLDGPHPLRIQTPLHELICSIDPTPTGRKSCFGFMFADLSWDEQTITVLLTTPFYDTDLNPEATPFDSVSVQVELGDQPIYDGTLPVDPGDPIQPDPCGQVCWHATVDANIE